MLSATMSSIKPSPPARKQSLKEGSPTHSAKDVKEIKEVAKKAIKEHQELQRQYSQKEIQTLQLVQELEETKDILSKLESASGQVVQEYEDVQTKLDIEQQCREEAEKIASKVGFIQFGSVFLRTHISLISSTFRMRNKFVVIILHKNKSLVNEGYYVSAWLPL
ncbi:uncharacterized protein LOC115923950 [Strongylocentrotus purpuratus]|uniref:Shootin-1 n=1 Tax=Strongylocentrotus purpuratus TaxID=7668 RepID=A0A7M7NSX1_STRPU|nr:uncharacterized protein LOC115923950 [Strongylocentrotus purpuratus]